LETIEDNRRITVTRDENQRTTAEVPIGQKGSNRVMTRLVLVEKLDDMRGCVVAPTDVFANTHSNPLYGLKTQNTLSRLG